MDQCQADASMRLREWMRCGDRDGYRIEFVHTFCEKLLFYFATAAALAGQLIRIDAGIIKSNYHACICATIAWVCARVFSSAFSSICVNCEVATGSSRKARMNKYLFVCVLSLGSECCDRLGLHTATIDFKLIAFHMRNVWIFVQIHSGLRSVAIFKITYSAIRSGVCVKSTQMDCIPVCICPAAFLHDD